MQDVRTFLRTFSAALWRGLTVACNKIWKLIRLTHFSCCSPTDRSSCPAGKYSQSQATICTVCESGKFQDQGKGRTAAEWTARRLQLARRPLHPHINVHNLLVTPAMSLSCKGLRTCEPGSYVSSQPTTSTDRACTLCGMFRNRRLCSLCPPFHSLTLITQPTSVT